MWSQLLAWPAAPMLMYIATRMCRRHISTASAPLATATQPANGTPSSSSGGLNGVLCVYKPKSMTSNAALTVLKRVAAPHARHGGKRAAGSLKVGHGGTLDKSARGLLVVGFGKGTKQLGSFLASEKAYLATGQLGLHTDSHDLDAEATVLWADKKYDHVTLESLEAFLASQYCSSGGVVSQTPPLFSALKQNGQRLSSRARAGQTVDLTAKTRPVRVYSIRVVDFSPPLYTLSITCGGGFYVRSLVRDIGEHFNCGSTLVDLARTRQSGFTIEEPHVITLEHLAQESQHAAQADRPSADPSTSSTPTSASASAYARPPPPLDPTWSFLPCTRDNLLSVLAVPLDQRRIDSLEDDSNSNTQLEEAE